MIDLTEPPELNFRYEDEVPGTEAWPSTTTFPNKLTSPVESMANRYLLATGSNTMKLPCESVPRMALDVPPRPKSMYENDGPRMERVVAGLRVPIPTLPVVGSTFVCACALGCPLRKRKRATPRIVRCVRSDIVRLLCVIPAFNPSTFVSPMITN